MASTEAIRCENLTKRFGGFTAVDNLSLSVEEGASFGFLGPNGAGKTTTLRPAWRTHPKDGCGSEVRAYPGSRWTCAPK